MKNVIVYSSPLCPWCTKVKDYLDSKNIPYEAYNVAKDRDKAMEMVDKSGQQGVPVLDIDGEIIIGFDKSSIDELLGL